MIRFNNDYNHGAFASILKELGATNSTSYAGYGEDEWCDKAETIIKKLVDNDDALIKFIPGATQANYVVIAAALSSVQSVIAADTGHINCHEAASIENTGHKILELPNTDGKITAQQIAACAKAYYDQDEPEYLTEPKMVYLSFPTEKGTLYSKKEIKEIHDVCTKYGMYLFVDGARMGYGLGSEKNDLTLKDFAELTDVFYIGGTKCGALFGEALIITAQDLKYRFKAYMKQNGAVLAKGWLMGLQFATMLESGEYFEAAKRADVLAMQIKKAFEGKGVPFAGRLFQLSPYDAARKLMTDFHLSPDKPPSAAALHAKRIRTEAQQLMENERLCFSVLSDYARVLRNWKVRYAPQSPDQPVHARFMEACHKLDETEYYLDILCAGDSHERAEVVQHQMEDGKLDRLRRRLEEIHKEELEDGNDTAGVA